MPLIASKPALQTIPLISREPSGPPTRPLRCDLTQSRVAIRASTFTLLR